MLDCIIDYSDGIAIATELNMQGISCNHFKTVDGAVIITHFFRINRAEDILKLPRALKILEFATGKTIARTERAEPSCFGLEFEKDKTAVLPLNKALKTVKPYHLLIGESTDGITAKIDLDETPHLLVAGCTGSGKSVLLNNFVQCILECNKRNNYYKLLIIDPKRVGYNKYNGISGTEVGTTTEDAYACLRYAVMQMDKRYAEMQAKGIDKWKGCRIVLIIDEFSDLILTSKRVVEPLIVRLAQMGRACGIHLIIATQRPTVNVVTGLIKANIPDRIALRVSGVRDSLVILDSKGAEKLKGKGDSLVKINGETKRVQCFYGNT